MPLNPIPMPLDTPLVEDDRTMSWKWVENFTARNLTLAASSQTIVDVRLTTQAAAIAATALAVGTSAALYRLSVIARITRAATTSSSLTPTIRWTTGGVAQSKTWPALTGNTTTTLLVESFPARIDATTSLTYEAAYATAGATAMQFSYEIVAERLG